MKAKHTNLTKALSVFLTAVMLFTVVSVGIVVPETRITAGAAMTHTAGAVIENIVVPETIYLKPVNGLMTEFQYYFNNKADGTADGTYSTSGSVLFSCPGAKNVSATLENTTFGTQTALSLTNGTAKSFTGKLVSGYDFDTATSLKWTFTYTDANGEVKTANAYTTVYAPYRYPTFAATRARNKRSVNPDIQSMAWVSGVQSIDNGGNHGIMTSSFDPMLGVVADPSIGHSQNDGGLNQDNGSSYHNDTNTPKTGYFQNSTYDKEGSLWVESQAVSPIANLVVDNTRFVNLSQVPNLKIGFVVSYVSEGSDDIQQRQFGYYFGNASYSTAPASGTQDFDDGNSYYSNQKCIDIADNTAHDSDGTIQERSYCYPRIVSDNIAWDKAVPVSEEILYLKGGALSQNKRDAKNFFQNNNSGGATNANIIRVKVTPVNKSALRSAVLNSYEYSADDYTEASWETYQSQVKADATALGTPGSTTTTATADPSVLVRKSYTVNYYGNGANSGSTASSTHEKNVAKNLTPNGYIKNGYNFAGWKAFEVVNNVETEIGTFADSAEVVNLSFSTNVVNMYAQWEKANFTVTYDTLGGTSTAISDTVYDIEGGMTIPDTAVTKDYYDFQNKWKVSATSGTWIKDNNYECGTVMPAGTYGDVTLIPVYAPHEYTATFYDEDGTSVINVDDAAKKYTIESTHTLPPASKEGYDFAGWTLMSDSVGGAWSYGTTYTSSTPYTGKYGDVKFKANWAVKSATVTFDIKSDESFGTATENYFYDKPLVVEAVPVKTGYTFAGWKVKSVAAGGTWAVGDVYTPDPVTSAVTLPANKLGDVTLEATWTANKYNVSFNANGGTAVAGITDYTIESSFTLPASSKNGYTFGGWQVSGTQTGNWTAASYNTTTSYTGMYGEVTLIAIWNPITYKASLVTNGGDLGTAPAEISFTTESSTTELRLPQPIKTGYDFKSWKVTSAEGTWVADKEYTDYLDAGKYGNVTLTAQWKASTYSIKFSTIGSAVSDKYYTIEDAAFTLPATECPGYTFNGWKVTSAGGSWASGEIIGISETITGCYGNIVVEAQFTPVPYTITYSYPDGTTSTQTYTITESITLKDCAVDGYAFKGWKVSANSGSWYEGAIFEDGSVDAGMYGNVTLEAVTEANTYSIVFDSNGGTAYPGRTYTPDDKGDGAALPVPEKTGYDFAGWAATENSGNWVKDVVLSTDATVTGKYGNVTLKATWTAKKYTITWITGAGTFTTEVAYGELPVFTGDTHKDPDAQYNYTFSNSWSPAVTAVTGEATYTAQYNKTLRTYTVKWITEINENPADNKTTTETYSYGATPVYNGGATPVKESSNPADHVWRFVGWDKTVAEVTGNVTYTAQFKSVKAPRTVTWIIDGVSENAAYEVGETPDYGSTPYKAPLDGYEYIFTGWDPEIAVVAENTDYTYTAQFNKVAKTYTASFDANGGTLISDEIQFNLVDGLAMPAATRNGYAFDGWKVTAKAGTWELNAEYASDATVTGKWGDVTFTAKWKLAEYTVTFNCPDGTAPAAMTYTIESTDTLPVCTREGYEMAVYTVTAGTGSWNLGTSAAVGEALTGRYGNVTLTPIWYPKTYTITWISGETTQTTDVQYGAVITALEPIEKAGYTAEWDKTVPGTMPAGDLTFEAVYELIDYNVRVIVNGGESIDNFTYTIEDDKVLPTPVREGSVFNGWRVTIASGNWTKGALLDAGTPVNGKYGNITITAEWTLETHFVTFVAGDVTKVTEWYHGSIPFYNGTPVKSSDEYNSYVFVGWNSAFQPVTGDVVYTALFEAVERVYKVTWNVDGNELVQEYAYGTMPSYPGGIPEKDSTTEYDFEFMGWDKTVEPVTSDITYIAEWDIFTKLIGLSLDLSAVELEPDGTAQLTAKIYPATATVKDVKWTSLDTGVVAVDNDGKLTAVNTGEALVKVSSVDGAFVSYCLVRVKPIVTRYIKITANGISTKQHSGTVIDLSATVMPDNATDVSMSWSSSAPSVARVDANGRVTFVSSGTATITCVANDGYATGYIEVTTLDADGTAGGVDVNKETFVIFFTDTESDYILYGTQYGGLQLFVNAQRDADGNLIETKTVEFKTAKPCFVLLDGEVMLKDDDGVYRIKDVDANHVIMTSPNEYDLPSEEELPETIQDIEKKTTFFERIQAFFRKIIEWFRNLFK